VHHPVPASAEVYRKLYSAYTTLHDAFGTASFKGSLHGVMKDLIRTRNAVRSLA
jgi:hypothetical protein